jgi:nitroreductase
MQDQASNLPSQSTSADTAQIVDDAITSRRSIRAYLPTPISRATIEDILRVASRAPSGSNVQPWKVHVLTGDAKQRLSTAIIAAYDDTGTSAEHVEPYQYYPRTWIDPYLARRRKIGWDLYNLLGIVKGDKAKMHAQHGRNYRFFDAPVGLIFTIDPVLEQGSWLDYGMFIEAIMVAARGRGLDTCPQAAFNQFHKIIAEHIGLAEGHLVVCGMALGYADPDAIENTLQTERADVADVVRFLD